MLFSRMGLPDVLDSRVILIENVEKVFVNPTGAEFKDTMIVWNGCQHQ